MTEWFARWFGETYLQLYPHRDEVDAQRLISLIEEVLPVRDLRVLDLACGEGRHTVLLNQLGAHTVGFDLSATLLRRGRNASAMPLEMVRGDMRALPFRSASFDAVVNLFTSFGYFADDRDHEHVLRLVSDILVPNGWFVFDFLNSHHVKATLVEWETKDTDAGQVEIERRLVDDGRYVEKTMRITGQDDAHLERVRLFSPDDLRRMHQNAGLDIVREFGDYERGPLTDGATRTILFSRKQ